VEGLAEVEVGGGTALVTPVPNLPEFKIFFTWGVGGPAALVVVVRMGRLGGEADGFAFSGD
jgi:hypothetical protein